MEVLTMPDTALYRTVWRWHFYAGLFVIPFIILLSLTGAVFLFKPQIDRWEERAWLHQPISGAVSPDTQHDAALGAVPGARFVSYRLPREPGDAAMIELALPGSGASRDLFVSPQGKVLGSLDPEARIATVVERIHGQLLLGKRGSWLVELAASWAIVLIVTGLYLWWPRGRALAGVVWPRLGSGKRVFLRDLHAVTGFWVSGLALVLLTTALPWTDVWGSAFKAVRGEMGWVEGKQDWTIGGRPVADDPHAGHDQMAMAMPGMEMAQMNHGAPPVQLSRIVAAVEREGLAFPVIVTPPGKSPNWTAKSNSQNRPLRQTLQYDPQTAAMVSRETFADKHPIDQIVGYGVAWHEGQLFGWFNQLVGVATAVMLVTLAVSGFLMWRRRKPIDRLGALPPANDPAKVVAMLVIALAVVLPLLAASLIGLWLLERLALRRWTAISRWQGLADSRART
jgi:uncharacterized iron-regulated membrane protein